MSLKHDDPKKGKPANANDATSQKPASKVFGNASREIEGQDRAIKFCTKCDLMRERIKTNEGLIEVLRETIKCEIEDAITDVTPETRENFNHIYRWAQITLYRNSLDKGPEDFTPSNETVIKAISDLNFSVYMPSEINMMKEELMQIANQSPCTEIRDAASKKLFGLKSN